MQVHGLILTFFGAGEVRLRRMVAALRCSFTYHDIGLGVWGKIMSDEKSYWSANLRIVGRCLVIWFAVSFLFGIVLVEPLNSIRLGGYKLGFWFAQQGSIYSFIVLVFYYAHRMARLDREYGVEEND